MFTNIPVDETISILIAKIFINKDTRFHGLNKLQFIKQIDDVAMGSPLVRTLADVFMIDFDNKIMDRLKEMSFKRLEQVRRRHICSIG